MTATTFLLLAAAAAVGLLLLLHLRLNRRQEALHLRFSGFEQERKRDVQELGGRLHEMETLLRDVDEGLRPSVATLDERFAQVERKVDDAVARIEALGEASAAAENLAEARERLERWTADAESRLAAMTATLEATRDRAEHLDTQLARVRDVLGERIGSLEHRLASAARAAPAPSAARRPAVDSLNAAPPAEGAEAGKDEAPEAPRTRPGPVASAVAPPPVTDTRVVSEGFTFEGEPNEPAHLGLKWVLVVVAMLAFLTMLFHALGMGG